MHPIESGQTDTMNKGVDPMRQLTTAQVLVSALCAGALAMGTMGCSRQPEVHKWADVPEAKMKGKFEIGPLKSEMKGRPAAQAGARTKSR